MVTSPSRVSINCVLIGQSALDSLLYRVGLAVDLLYRCLLLEIKMSHLSRSPQVELLNAVEDEKQCWET
jgi:hypothetical protein